jgi:hypothetical protein
LVSFILYYSILWASLLLLLDIVNPPSKDDLRYSSSGLLIISVRSIYTNNILLASIIWCLLFM